jgi:phage baseplate assembly protein W
METELSFLGTGWSFPPSFDNKFGKAFMVSAEEDVAQSLRILLSTRPGERVMLPQFGCNLDILLFEPITTAVVAYIKDLIQTAVLYHEPRVELETININTVQANEGLILIELEYTIPATNSRYNLVYPYYLEEGTVEALTRKI